MTSKGPLLKFSGFLVLSWLLAIGGCSTTELSPSAPPPPPPAPEQEGAKIPPYASVPHPAGMDIGDLRAIFADRSAPTAENLTNCDQDYQRLKAATQVESELREGTAELVRRDPVALHWCFYHKLLDLENQLKLDIYVEEKQQHVLNAFAFLVPVAKAYAKEFKDSRYLRWAIFRYRRLSEWVFYRKLDLTPQMTAELVESANPFSGVRPPGPDMPVLQKYGIVKEGPATVTTITAPPPAQAQDRAPAAADKAPLAPLPDAPAGDVPPPPPAEPAAPAASDAPAGQRSSLEEMMGTVPTTAPEPEAN